MIERCDKPDQRYGIERWVTVLGRKHCSNPVKSNRMVVKESGNVIAVDIDQCDMSRSRQKAHRLSDRKRLSRINYYRQTYGDSVVPNPALEHGTWRCLQTIRHG